MKQVLCCVSTIMILVLTGCGSGVTTVTTAQVSPISPPAITALQFSQDSVNDFITGSVDFHARDVDLDTMTIVVTNSAGREVFRTLTDLRTFSGISLGTISFSIDYISFLPDRYTFTLFLTDRLSSFSNPVFGDFLVL